MRPSLFLAGVCLLLSGCRVMPGWDAQASLGEDFSLGINQTAYIESENLIIGFKEVEQDSRCPSDVVCVWEGMAKVGIEGRATDGADFDVILSTQSRTADFSDLSGKNYSIELISLEPYPISTRPIKPEEYTATLKVVKS